MGGLALLAREAGHQVSGCDAAVYPPMSDQLRSHGIDLIEGFGAEQCKLKPDVFVIGNVVSRATQPDGSAKFPIMEAILNEGLRYTSGPQWLSEHILQGRHVIAIAGTHGKTTTTAMVSWILEAAGLQPGFLIGGVPLNFSSSARLGRGAHFVIEADEYDTAFFDKRSKFLHYRPRTAVLNNLEFDHADIFDNLEAIERQFHHLLRTVPSNGRVIVNGLEESLQRVIQKGCWAELRRFGAQDSDWRAVGEPHAFTVYQRDSATAQVQWALSGVHNQLNALAAIAAADHIGIDPAQAAQALSCFDNVKRRLELRERVQISTGGEQGEVCVFDDFAHHPTAFRTTLDGLRARLQPGQRIVAVFEPRSNTMKLGAMKAQLPWSLASADRAICHASGLDWDAAAALSPMGARAQVTRSIEQTVDSALADIRPGDQIVCMSNGGFGGIHQKLIDRLRSLVPDGALT